MMVRPFVVVFLMVVLGGVGPALAGVVAKGEGVIVTTEDMAAMEKASPPFFTPTRKALIEATVRTLLFAKEAEARDVPCEGSLGKQGFDRAMALSRCYLKERLDQVGLKQGAVVSYYRAHEKMFLDKNGDPVPLDERLREIIRARILRAKAPIFARSEYRRLVNKYKVTICPEDGC